ncbi:thiol reductant ABC exporter subunit CydC [Pseudoalteromonas sp. APAL1]|uniref:thiol reductant ABC exporter subunit CydC n=1 Tax=Pseudoalteromonas TaxID=53246 RepID=UPI000EB858CD|nr:MULTISPECIES: thiol reductant ABC exporter subunit CydC [unclassified Pseudoalteromonas]MCF2919372.1 thiol reductant ABC exporter subunit CydC [Pseudoalteromonas sp. APAL1]HCV04343.1 thiol reductant ABC exporter subunit CydC [Pseudoalteromonas sp.]|tara:strand:- start:1769 stop:3508 length:1740 start_codon:yes stop_codon:yes gene_type:complete
MHNFIRLLKLCKPHAGMLLLGAFLASLTVLANVGLLAISGWFLAAMAAAGIAGVQMNYFTPAGVIRFLAIVRTASRYCERMITHNATFLLLSEIRVKMFKTLSQLNNVDLAMTRSSDLFNRLQNDVDALDKFYLNVLLPIIVALISIPIVMAFMAMYNADVALLCFISLMIIGVLLPALLSHKLRQQAHAETLLSAELRSELADTLSGARELAVYQAHAAQLAHCDSLSKQYNSLLYNRHKAIANSNGLSTLVIQLTMLASVFIIIPLVATATMKNVELAMLALFVLASFETVLTLPSAFIELPNALSAAQRLFTLEDKLEEHNEQKQAHAIPHSALGLEFKNVNYRYQGATSNALNEINLSIASGSKLALVGASGSGKTTLVNLLTGLWPIQSGTLELTTKENTFELSKLSHQQRFKCMTIVAQQHHIFDGTLRENLRYAAFDATDEMLIEACEQAELGSWLSNLKDGLNTRLGTAGRKLSHGQSRRVAIAQALLRQGNLIILDEPTESLDNHTKQNLLTTLEKIWADKTMLTITHDPAMLSRVDKVIWLEQGQVRALASHAELVANEADYVELITRF